MSDRLIIKEFVTNIDFCSLCYKDFTIEQLIEAFDRQIVDDCKRKKLQFDETKGQFIFSIRDNSSDGDSEPKYDLIVYFSRLENDEEFKKRLEKERLAKVKEENKKRKNKLATEKWEKSLYLRLKKKYG